MKTQRSVVIGELFVIKMAHVASSRAIISMGERRT
jgi:hypothetical protein